jgi:cation diffusion facilitator CzcD-associated flavoprotein CzcO
MDRFAGRIVHPQAWPEDLDYEGKRIVVIGSGATAVTLIPALAATAGHVVMLQRSPSYIASLPAEDPIANLLRRVLPRRLAGPAIRWFKALTTQAFFQLSRHRPAMVKRLLRDQVKRQLPDGYDVGTHFSPRYNPWDQRLCLVPNGDLFEAISAGRASVVTDQIDQFTETGLRLESGAELDADIIVTATGLELLFLGGIELSVDGNRVDVASRLVYKGMMLEGAPNLAIAVGYTNASWTLKCDLTCDYVCRLLNHMRAVGMRQCTPTNTDPSMESQPLLPLSSGYVLRSADRFPKQGLKDPWRVYQSYLRDYRVLKRGGVEDGALLFSHPVGDHTPVAAAS